MLFSGSYDPDHILAVWDFRLILIRRLNYFRNFQVPRLTDKIDFIFDTFQRGRRVILEQTRVSMTRAVEGPLISGEYAGSS
jgi:hypothetical protein